MYELIARHIIKSRTATKTKKEATVEEQQEEDVADKEESPN